jgi:hypothetical protein
MEVYHGGYCSIELPEIIAGKYAKDFGAGFYCTEIKEQAARWAKRYTTFKHPTHQINFCTKQALRCLTFIKSEEVTK